MEELKPCPQEAEALDIIESLLDVADMKCTGPLYADAPPRSGMCRIPEDDAIKLRQYIADRRAAPENKPLTLDELRGMDGEPVWIVEAPDWGHWELSEHAEDYLDDRDPDFYGMKHDDPAGRYGLHVLGWLAYARRPEGSEING